jgi:glycosyltransferase involved in cell wall biosynthesis
MKISVIIPVKNEEVHIKGLLDSLSTQSRKADEIVIVDGGSTDRTVEIIDGYKKKGLSIKLIKVLNALPGRGRNIAIEAAQYDTIAMTDAGIVLDRMWLEKLITPFEKDPSIEVVYGVYDCYTETLFEKCFCIVYMSAGKQIGSSKVNFPFIASSAIKKDIWKKIGGFKEDLRATEDLIFLKIIEEMKYKTALALEAVAYWRPRSSLTETVDLSFKYAICDAISLFHIWRYVKKYIMYSAGIFLIYLGIKNHIWLLLLLTMFFLNAFLVCNKHRNDFFKIFFTKPIAIFIISTIILAIDVGSLSGFSIGLFKRHLFRKT